MVCRSRVQTSLLGEGRPDTRERRKSSLLNSTYDPRYVFFFHPPCGTKRMQLIRVFYLARSRTPTLTRKMYVYICRSHMCLCFMSFYLFFLLDYLTLISSVYSYRFYSRYLNAFGTTQGNCSVLTLAEGQGGNCPHPPKLFWDKISFSEISGRKPEIAEITLLVNLKLFTTDRLS